MCDGHNHNLEVIYKAEPLAWPVAHVVRWCRDCGAVVVDAEGDGRTYPGNVMEMKFPKKCCRKCYL
jgi:hypothetical protein